MKIYQPEGLNELGDRAKNDDYVFPQLRQRSERDNLFIVCDGVGGQKNGEIASRLVGDSLASFFKRQPITNELDPAGYLNAALVFANQQMEQYLQNHPESRGMGSTVSLLYLGKNVVWIGWAGDSRVYHIRDGEIKYRTKDHSLVENLLRLGEIREDEVATHPQRNVITRYIDGLKKKVSLETHLIQDIKANDFFLLCTDGVLENLREAQIQGWFKITNSVAMVKNLIQEQAANNTQDNYSFYLVKIKAPPSASGSRLKNLWKFFKRKVSFLMRYRQGRAGLLIIALMRYLYLSANF
ncbi:MAG: serine/threonine-protein phosphatase [Bacteroidia bacterium]|nr:serine/threonine-protein phosphatase [Bacteroidia bacterium]